MKNNKHNRSEQMWKWLTQGAVRVMRGEKDEFTYSTAKDLTDVFEASDEHEIEAFFNALCFSNGNEMIGFVDTEAIFHKTVEKYPDLCGTLVVYVYS